MRQGWPAGPAAPTLTKVQRLGGLASHSPADELTEPGVAAYLIRRGLVPALAVTCGRVRISNISGRNAMFTCTDDDGPSYVVKRTAADAVESDTDAGVSVEGPVSRLISRFVPDSGFRLYDDAAGMLVLDLARHSRDLRRHHVETGRLPASIAAAVGRLLAEVHSIPLARLRWLRARQPPVFSVQRPSLQVVQSVSSANLELLTVIQRHTELCTLLDDAVQVWEPLALVHGDLRWDNCIVLRGSRRKAGVGVRLIDWEFARRGDPHWDLASFIAEYVAWWTAGLVPARRSNGDHLVQQVPAAAIHRPIASFWRAYVRGRGLPRANISSSLITTTKLVAVALIERAAQQLHDEARFGGHAAVLLQVAFNILRAPATAADELLGLGHA